MPDTVHLVRHGEVENPDHIIYADLQEFSLSPIGDAQAQATADYLADRPVRLVCSSPLTRAIQTASTIAAPHGLEVLIVDRLTEFGLSQRWRGLRWEELPQMFPGELEAYLAHPEDLPFSPESLEEMAERMDETIRNLRDRLRHGELVIVSHQDPVQAGRLALTERGWSSFGYEKPGHAEVITLQPGTPWRELSSWRPPIDSGPFPPLLRDG